ncbi:hypothetical protein GW17_00040547 [Ensete ventricosum]|nr:hypothetical protein GW17_00040547 [Ensete ventricosum]
MKFEIPTSLLYAGGTFALYSLLCRHARVSTIPNQHRTDEQLTTYSRHTYDESSLAAKVKRWLESHAYKKNALLILVLVGTCMAIGDGILTPVISGELFSFFYISVWFCIDTSSFFSLSIWSILVLSTECFIHSFSSYSLNVHSSSPIKRHAFHVAFSLLLDINNWTIFYTTFFISCYKMFLFLV